MPPEGWPEPHHAEVVACDLFATPNSLKSRVARKVLSPVSNPVSNIHAVTPKLRTHSTSTAIQNQWTSNLRAELNLRCPLLGPDFHRLDRTSLPGALIRSPRGRGPAASAGSRGRGPMNSGRREPTRSQNSMVSWRLSADGRGDAMVAWSVSAARLAAASAPIALNMRLRRPNGISNFRG
jgi:hypothetical protein